MGRPGPSSPQHHPAPTGSAASTEPSPPVAFWWLFLLFQLARPQQPPSSMHASRGMSSSRVQRQEKSSRDRAFGGSQVPGRLCGVSILLPAPCRGPSTHLAAAPAAVPIPAPSTCPIAGGSCSGERVLCCPLPPDFTRAAEQEPGEPQGQAGAAGCKHRVPG